jgi:DNA-binding FadR family transcriptional regulator
LFKPASTVRVFQDVLSQLENAILNNQIKQGERLPPEREMIEAMRISRPTLREALRALEHKGLIEIRLGVKGGAYVKALDLNKVASGIGILIKQKNISLRHLYEFREGVDGYMAGLAAERATPEDLARLEALLDEVRQVLEKDGDIWQEFYAKEAYLHQELIHISNNPMFELTLSLINTGIPAYAHLMPNTKKDLQNVLADWEGIVRAMHDKQVTKVQTLVNAHASRANTWAQQAGEEYGQKPRDILL